jgi:hypothetical protein
MPLPYSDAQNFHLVQVFPKLKYLLVTFRYYL